MSEIDAAVMRYRKHLAAEQAEAPSISAYYRSYGSIWVWSPQKESDQELLARAYCESTPPVAELPEVRK